jgi:CelD/BcsL family acetyltransferase involved in cellulose biosynthesis
MLSTDIIATAFGGDEPVLSARAVAMARIELFDDVTTAAPVWRQLIDRDALATPYGRIEWVDAWYRHVGACKGETPLIVAGFDAANTPLFLLPLAVSRSRELTVARFAGGKHSQLNLGLWRRDTATAWRAEVLQAALADVATSRGIDLFALRNQPLTWQGVAAPLALLPHQAAPDNAYCARWPRQSGDDAIRTTTSAGNRKRLRTKERKLQAIDGYRLSRAATGTEIDRLLPVFLEQKRRYFAAYGIKNPFDEPGIAEFLRASCLRGLDTGHPTIELHAIEAGGEVLAIVGGTSDGRRFSAMFNSITDNEHMARLSPGLVLMLNLIRGCADRGLTSYDHGIGFAPYKQQFCRDVDRLFDSFLGFTGRGRIAALGYRLTFAAKRLVKTTTPIWALVRGLRQLRARLRRA